MQNSSLALRARGSRHSILDAALALAPFFRMPRPRPTILFNRVSPLFPGASLSESLATTTMIDPRSTIPQSLPRFPLRFPAPFPRTKPNQVLTPCVPKTSTERPRAASPNEAKSRKRASFYQTKPIQVLTPCVPKTSRGRPRAGSPNEANVAHARFPRTKPIPSGGWGGGFRRPGTQGLRGGASETSRPSHPWHTAEIIFRGSQNRAGAVSPNEANSGFDALRSENLAGPAARGCPERSQGRAHTVSPNEANPVGRLGRRFPTPPEPRASAPGRRKPPTQPPLASGGDHFQRKPKPRGGRFPERSQFRF